MKYIIHFLFFCYSYSYMMDSPFPAFEKEYVKKSSIRSDIDRNKLNSENHSKHHLPSKKVHAFKNSQRNHLKNIARNLKNLRRHYSRRQTPEHLGNIRNEHDSSVLLDSSTVERENFQQEFKDGRWLHKQFEALNRTLPKGDGVNMLAVRPWGVPCGDPNQLDMATGTCTLAMECDPELRIYRGDHFCKRGSFVCCAILETAYDLNQPFDASFAGTSFDTNTEEQQNKGELKKDPKAQEQFIRTHNRHKRKSEMKKLIDRIVREVRGIMNKAYKNGTKEKLKRTRQLKKFLLDLKNQYKKDRQSLKDVHEINQIRIDGDLRNKLFELKEVYEHFMNNETFRNIILSGTNTMSERAAAMLVEAYPEVGPYINKRRNNQGDLDKAYDVEYGLMYY